MRCACLESTFLTYIKQFPLNQMFYRILMKNQIWKRGTYFLRIFDEAWINSNEIKENLWLNFYRNYFIISVNLISSAMCKSLRYSCSSVFLFFLLNISHFNCLGWVSRLSISSSNLTSCWRSIILNSEWLEVCTIFLWLSS